MKDVDIINWIFYNDIDYDLNNFQTAPDKSMFFHAQEYCWEQGNLGQVPQPNFC